ncbi:MAG: MipA/OmpV family protein [Sphingobium sp.]
MTAHTTPIRHIFGVLALTTGVTMTAPAMAQTADNPDHVTVVVGAAMVPSYEGSDNSRVVPGIVVRGQVKGHPFFSRGTVLYGDLIRNDDPNGLDIGFGPVVGARFNRVSGIGDDRVRALGKLDTAWELGGWVGIAKTGVITSDYDNLSLRVAYTHDVAGAHGSYVITPAIEYGTPLSMTTYVGLSLSADYAGKGYGRTYYDIDQAGSLASGLNPYDGAGRKAGFVKVNAGMMAAKSLSGDLRKGWALTGAVVYSRLMDRYAHSPIVADAGSRNQWIGALGVAYTF